MQNTHHLHEASAKARELGDNEDIVFLHAGEQGAQFPVREAAGAAYRFFNPLVNGELFLIRVFGPTELKLRPDLIEGLVYPQNFPSYIWHWHFAAKIDGKAPVTDPKRGNNAGSTRYVDNISTLIVPLTY
jgi:hypothetical protein